LAVALSVFLNSCDPEDNLAVEADRETFERVRAAWVDQNLTDYQFTYIYMSPSIGPFGPFTVTVRENEEPVIETEGRHADNLAFKDIFEYYDYISESFDFIESLRNGTDDGPKVRSVKLNITYNSQFHYPEEAEMSIEYVENIAGGMRRYTLQMMSFATLN
jgi:hypothetical protein